MNYAMMNVDALESRTMFSGTTNPAVAADIAQLQTDVAKFKADQAASYALLTTDKQAVEAACKALSGQRDLLKAQLKADQATWKTTLDADKAALKAAEDAGKVTIQADYAKIMADPDGSDARKADIAQMLADKASIKATMDPLRAKFASDVQAMNAALKADHQAIESLTSDDLKAAKSKFEADRKAAEALLKADQQLIKADQEQIKKDAKNNLENHTEGNAKTKK